MVDPEHLFVITAKPSGALEVQLHGRISAWDKTKTNPCLQHVVLYVGKQDTDIL